MVKRGLQREEHKGFKVMVADGYKISCTHNIFNLTIHLGDYELKDELYVVNIGDIDVVLGMHWMPSLCGILQFVENRDQV